MFNLQRPTEHQIYLWLIERRWRSRRLESWLQKRFWRQRAMATAAKVNAILQGSYSPAGIDAWWHRERHQLGGRTPTEALNQGDGGLVLKLAESLRDMGAT